MKESEGHPGENEEEEQSHEDVSKPKMIRTWSDIHGKWGKEQQRKMMGVERHCNLSLYFSLQNTNK